MILSGSRFSAGVPERRTYESRCSDAVYAIPDSINRTQEVRVVLRLQVRKGGTEQSPGSDLWRVP